MATCDVNILKDALGIQQTGPRTVIVPADPIIWNAGTSYEYLTIVASTGFGQGYVSKRDVPAGTPLTDTDYWIPVASFNAQLSDIQTTLHTKADTATVTALQQSLNNEISRAKAAEQEINTVATNALNSALNYRKECVVLIGDSFLNGVNSDTSTTGSYGWDNKFKTCLNPKKCYSFGNNSAGFKATGTSGEMTGMTYSAMVNYAAEHVDDPDEISLVIFQGAWNDIRVGAPNEPSLVNAAVNNVKTNFKNARILIEFVVAGSVDGLADVDYIGNLDKAYQWYENAAAISGCMFGHTCGTSRYNLSNDGIHPNRAGQDMIGANIAAHAMGSTNTEIVAGNPSDGFFNENLQIQMPATFTVPNAISKGTTNVKISGSDVLAPTRNVYFNAMAINETDQSAPYSIMMLAKPNGDILVVSSEVDIPENETLYPVTTFISWM